MMRSDSLEESIAEVIRVFLGVERWRAAEYFTAVANGRTGGPVKARRGLELLRDLVVHAEENRSEIADPGLIAIRVSTHIKLETRPPRLRHQWNNPSGNLAPQRIVCRNNIARIGIANRHAVYKAGGCWVEDLAIEYGTSQGVRADLSIGQQS